MMKAVYSSPQLFWVSFYKDILQSNGIDCFVKNEFLSGGAGELPPNECWPILLVEDDDFNLAKQIVDQELKSAKPMQPSWTCMKCKEINEPQFKMCWNCGASYNVSSINNVNK